MCAGEIEGGVRGARVCGNIVRATIIIFFLLYIERVCGNSVCANIYFRACVRKYCACDPSFCFVRACARKYRAGDHILFRACARK